MLRFLTRKRIQENIDCKLISTMSECYQTNIVCICMLCSLNLIRKYSENTETSTSVTFGLEVLLWPYIKVKKADVIRCRLLYCTLLPGMISMGLRLYSTPKETFLLQSFLPFSWCNDTYIIKRKFLRYITNRISCVAMATAAILWFLKPKKDNLLASFSQLYNYRSPWKKDYFDP